MPDSGGPRRGPTGSAIVPPRRMSLEESEAFPIESPKTLEAPGVPLDLGTAPVAAGKAAERPLRRLIAIVLVVVGILGFVTAARFFMAAAHRPPTQDQP